MLTSCFGLPLRTGTAIISIFNTIVSICYIIYYIWEYNLNYGYTQYDPENSNELTFSKYRGIIEEVFLNYITLVFMLAGFTWMFASLGLKQSTIKNATHKIYLWLLVGYVQFGTIVTIEIFVIIKHTHFASELVGLFVCFAFIDAIIVYQLLVVQSFYAEEKLVEETNYTKLRSELTSQMQHHSDDEFQTIELEL